MIKSRKRHEGYLMIDHTFSPGVPEELTKPLNLITAAPGKKLEAATLTCSHCQKTVILNPQRTRARGYCPSCDHFVCDLCEGIRQIQGCQNIKKVTEELIERAARNLNLGEI